MLFVGAGCGSWTAVVEGLGEVLEASAFPRAGGEGWKDVTSPDLDRVLWRLGDDPEVRAFIERRLRPVVDHDRRRAVKLLPALEAFVVASGQKSEMARLLHLERQSVYSASAARDGRPSCGTEGQAGSRGHGGSLGRNQTRVSMFVL